MGVFQEFKKFAMRGNVIDMAVGIIIGGAFGTVVKSLVDNVLMPPLGVLSGGLDFKEKAITLRPGVEATANTEAQPEVLLNYGLFFNAVISFLIVAFAVFLLVKAVNRAEEALWEEKEEQKPATPPAPAEDVVLLREIRDLLKREPA